MESRHASLHITKIRKYIVSIFNSVAYNYALEWAFLQRNKVLICCFQPFRWLCNDRSKLLFTYDMLRLRNHNFSFRSRCVVYVIIIDIKKMNKFLLKIYFVSFDFKKSVDNQYLDWFTPKYILAIIELITKDDSSLLVVILTSGYLT